MTYKRTDGKAHTFRPMAKKANGKQSDLFAPINPTKRHFTKWLKSKNGAWLSENEPVVSTLKSIVKDAEKLGKFQSHYPDHLAIAYGVKNDLLTFKLNPTDKRYTLIYLTPKAFSFVVSLQKTTCALTGRSV